MASLGPSLSLDLTHLAIREPEPFQEIAPLSSAQVDEALRRLRSHGLIDGDDSQIPASSKWSRLRVTAYGWIVLGEWPDLDRVASAASLHRLLRAVAEQAPQQEKKALIRAAGVIGRTGNDVLRETIAELAHDLGGEAT
jgi:hypothetical protein